MTINVKCDHAGFEPCFNPYPSSSTMTSTLPPLVQAFSGAIGSATANALTYPLDLLTTRLQLEPPESRKPRGGLYGASMIFRHIADKYGWHAFYDGLTADTYATLLSKWAQKIETQPHQLDPTAIIWQLLLLLLLRVSSITVNEETYTLYFTLETLWCTQTLYDRGASTWICRWNRVSAGRHSS